MAHHCLSICSDKAVKAGTKKSWFSCCTTKTKDVRSSPYDVFTVRRIATNLSDRPSAAWREEHWGQAEALKAKKQIAFSVRPDCKSERCTSQRALPLASVLRAHLHELAPLSLADEKDIVLQVSEDPLNESSVSKSQTTEARDLLGNPQNEKTVNNSANIDRYNTKSSTKEPTLKTLPSGGPDLLRKKHRRGISSDIFTFNVEELRAASFNGDFPQTEECDVIPEHHRTNSAFSVSRERSTGDDSQFLGTPLSVGVLEVNQDGDVTPAMNRLVSTASSIGTPRVQSIPRWGTTDSLPGMERVVSLTASSSSTTPKLLHPSRTCSIPVTPTSSGSTRSRRLIIHVGRSATNDLPQSPDDSEDSGSDSSESVTNEEDNGHDSTEEKLGKVDGESYRAVRNGHRVDATSYSPKGRSRIVLTTSRGLKSSFAVGAIAPMHSLTVHRDTLDRLSTVLTSSAHPLSHMTGVLCENRIRAAKKRAEVNIPWIYPPPSNSDVDVDREVLTTVADLLPTQLLLNQLFARNMSAASSASNTSFTSSSSPRPRPLLSGTESLSLSKFDEIDAFVLVVAFSDQHHDMPERDNSEQPPRNQDGDSDVGNQLTESPAALFLAFVLDTLRKHDGHLVAYSSQLCIAMWEESAAKSVPGLCDEVIQCAQRITNPDTASPELFAAISCLDIYSSISRGKAFGVSTPNSNITPVSYCVCGPAVQDALHATSYAASRTKGVSQELFHDAQSGGARDNLFHDDIQSWDYSSGPRVRVLSTTKAVMRCTDGKVFNSYDLQQESSSLSASAVTSPKSPRMPPLNRKGGEGTLENFRRKKLSLLQTGLETGSSSRHGLSLTPAAVSRKFVRRHAVSSPKSAGCSPNLPRASSLKKTLTSEPLSARLAGSGLSCGRGGTLTKKQRSSLDRIRSLHGSDSPSMFSAGSNSSLNSAQSPSGNGDSSVANSFTISIAMDSGSCDDLDVSQVSRNRETKEEMNEVYSPPISLDHEREKEAFVCDNRSSNTRLLERSGRFVDVSNLSSVLSAHVSHVSGEESWWSQSLPDPSHAKEVEEVTVVAASIFLDDPTAFTNGGDRSRYTKSRPVSQSGEGLCHMVRHVFGEVAFLQQLFPSCHFSVLPLGNHMRVNVYTNDALRAVRVAVRIGSVFKIAPFSCSVGIGSGSIVKSRLEQPYQFCTIVSGKALQNALSALLVVSHDPESNLQQVGCSVLRNVFTVEKKCSTVVEEADGITMHCSTSKIVADAVRWERVVSGSNVFGKVALVQSAKESRTSHNIQLSRVPSYSRRDVLLRLTSVFPQPVTSLQSSSTFSSKVVLLAAEVGMGKSFMLAQLRKLVVQQDESCLVFELAASKFESSSPWHMLRTMMNELVFIQPHRPNAIRGINSSATTSDPYLLASQIVGSVFEEHHPDMVVYLPLLGTISPFQFEENVVTLQLSACMRTEFTIQVFLAFMKTLLCVEDRFHPMCLLVHNAQWMDTISCEAFARLAALTHNTLVVGAVETSSNDVVPPSRAAHESEAGGPEVVVHNRRRSLLANTKNLVGRKKKAKKSSLATDTGSASKANPSHMTTKTVKQIQSVFEKECLEVTTVPLLHMELPEVAVVCSNYMGLIDPPEDFLLKLFSHCHGNPQHLERLLKVCDHSIFIGRFLLHFVSWYQLPSNTLLPDFIHFSVLLNRCLSKKVQSKENLLRMWFSLLQSQRLRKLSCRATKIATLFLSFPLYNDRGPRLLQPLILDM